MPLLLFFWLTDPLTLVYLLISIKGICLLNNKWGRIGVNRHKGEEGGSDMGHNGPCALQH